MKRKKKCLHCGHLRLSFAFELDERMHDGLRATCNECPTLDSKLIPQHKFAPTFRRSTAPAGPTVATPRTYVTYEPYVTPKVEYQRPDRSRELKSYGVRC